VPPADAAPPLVVRGLDVSIALTAAAPNAVGVLAPVTDNRWRPADGAATRVHAAVARARARARAHS
jgi:hypothetical protein